MKARVELRDPEHHARSFDVGAIVCDVCLEANPGKQWQTTPLPVLTEEQRAREKPTQRRTKCRPCGGLGCHVCNGVGRVVVAG